MARTNQILSSVVVGTFIALGLRFNQPRLIDGPRRTKLQAMIDFLAHEQALEIQRTLSLPSPYIRLLRDVVFPSGMGSETVSMFREFPRV